MKRPPRLLLLGALAVFCAAAPVGADEETDLWASLRDEGIYSLDQLVPGAPSPDSDEPLRAPGPLEDAPDSALARLGDPSDWRGKGSYRNPYFDSRPAPPGAGEVLEPGAWPTRGANRRSDEVDYYYADEQYDYYPDDDLERGYAYGRRALPNSRYGYGRAPAGASSGYGGPARPGGGYGRYSDDPDEDWEPDDGD